MKTFIDVLGRADRGQLKRDIETAMGEITDAVQQRGGTGKITVSLDIKRKGDAFQISASMEHKLPKAPRLDAIMFLDDDGALVGRDPRQPDLPVVRLADKANGTTGEDE